MCVRRPWSWFGWCLAGLLAVAGCSSDGGPSGGLSLELVLEGGEQINQVDWRITDPAAGDMLLKEGTIDTSAPGATASVEAYGLPPGGPYVIELSATSEDGGTTCKGSAEFDIAVGFVTRVHVMIQCKTDSDLGGVRVDAWVNICAQLDMVVVSSLDTSVGGLISVSAIASDKDGDPINYLWTATGGSFANPTAADTVFTCEEEGIQFITINVYDVEHCMDGHTVEIECIGDGGGTDGGTDGGVDGGVDGGAGGEGGADGEGGVGGDGGAGGAGGEGGAGGDGGAGGAGGEGMGGAGGMGMGGAGGMGMGGAGGAPACIPDGGAQWAGPVMNRPCGEGACGEMEVCVGGVCEAAALIFVSNTWSTAALGGPRGADMTCAELAEAAGLGGYWMSWTSDPCTSPYKRFEKSTLPYRMLDGVQIASSWERLTNRPPDEFQLENDFNMDQNGAFPGSVDQVTGLPTGLECPAPGVTTPLGCFVWTNTTVEGRVHALANNNGCLGLTTGDSSFANSTVGQMTSSGTAWTEGNNRNCGLDGGRIFCFEQSTAEPIP